MAKTLDTLTRNAGSDTLIAAGEVVELRFRDNARALSLRSAKLFHLLVDRAGSKACEDIEHRIPISELNFSHIESENLVDCIRDLVGTQVELKYKDQNGDIRTKYDPLIYGVDRHSNYMNGDLVYRLSPTLRLILEKSNHWAALSRSSVLAFKSRYALRLYELMTLRGGLNHKTIEIFELDDIRRRLGVPSGKMLRWNDIRRYVIELSIDEVNQISDLDVSYEPIKRGRRVAQVAIAWTQRSLGDSPSTSRQTEIPNTSKTSFPKHGNLKFGQQISHWRDLAEKHVKRLQGGYLPDLDDLADQFRAWCARQGLPLEASGVEKAFIGFCQKYRPPNAAD